MHYLFFAAEVFIESDGWRTKDPTNIELDYKCHGSREFLAFETRPYESAARFMESERDALPDNGFLMMIPTEDLRGVWNLKGNQAKTQTAVGGPYFFKFNKRSMYDIRQVNH